MRILLINQSFYPDISATAQQLNDLARGLHQRGHDVTVLCSRRGYDDPECVYPKCETWNGIKIVRVFNTGFGKNAKWRRALDFATFMISAIFALCRIPRVEKVVVLTSPPIISFIAALYCLVTRSRMVYWVMDLNPDEAIAAGWLRSDSVVAWFLERFSRFSLYRAETIIALDRFMKAKIVSKGIPKEKVIVRPPWSHDNEVRFDSEGREDFRKAHDLENCFVVMYAGNHSPCHPLDTVLEAARALVERKDIVFCFVGGGSGYRKINEEINSGSLQANILCLPYQPLSYISSSLSSADLHVVSMGTELVGTIHPCKIYNLLQINSPVLAIGPKESHLNDLLSTIGLSESVFSTTHGSVKEVTDIILGMAANKIQHRPDHRKIASQFSVNRNLPLLCRLIEIDPKGAEVPDFEIELDQAKRAVELHVG